MLRAAALLVTAALVGSPASGGAPLHLTLDGVLGERVFLGAPEQRRTTILSFTGRSAPAVAQRAGAELDEQTLGADLESVTIADVRRFGGWLKPMASLRLRKAAEEALARRRARRVDHGVDASDAVVRRWHLVADFDGRLFARFGVAPDPPRPVVFVIDRRGRAYGPYVEVRDVVAAIAEAERAAPAEGS